MTLTEGGILWLIDAMKAPLKASVVSLLFGLFVLQPHARGVIITAVETGGGVEFSTSGGFLGLPLVAPTFHSMLSGLAPSVNPLEGFIALGPDVLVDCFGGAAGVFPVSGAPFGTTLSSVGVLPTGDTLYVDVTGINLGAPGICIPSAIAPAVAAGAPIGASSMTIPGASFASLGLSLGTIHLVDTPFEMPAVTLAVVPEPSTYFAGAFALGIIGWTLLRKRKTMLTNPSQKA